MNKYLGIDHQKQSALKQIRIKNQKCVSHPISSTDLSSIKHCPLCKSLETVVISEVSIKKLIFFATSTCSNCLFTYRSIYPSLRWFQRAWNRVNREIYKNSLSVFNPEGERLRQERYQEYYEKLVCLGRGSLLDIGGGYGTGTNLFKKHGYNVETIEPEISKVNYIRNVLGIRVVASSIEHLLKQKFHSKKYDFIVFSQTLEHLSRPAFVLSNLKKILKPGGVLYLEIPIVWNYVNWSDSLYLPHKSNFTEENITDLVLNSGFEIIEAAYVYKHSKDVPWDYGLLLRLRRDNSPNPTYRKPVHTIQDIQNVYRKGLDLNTIPPPEDVLRYSVSHIEHTAQIINLEDKKIIGPNTSGLITFV